jgi:hypothetical protein
MGLHDGGATRLHRGVSGRVVGFFNHPAREFAPVEGIINDGEGQEGEQNQYDCHDIILTSSEGTRQAIVKAPVFNQMRL